MLVIIGTIIFAFIMLRFSSFGRSAGVSGLTILFREKFNESFEFYYNLMQNGGFKKFDFNNNMNASNTLSHNESLKILNLEHGATSVQIKRAHAAMMKKYHPDTGGSEYFAMRLNEARDVLLNKRK